jgi:hypothetical protein
MEDGSFILEVMGFIGGWLLAISGLGALNYVGLKMVSGLGRQVMVKIIMHGEANTAVFGVATDELPINW